MYNEIYLGTPVQKIHIWTVYVYYTPTNYKHIMTARMYTAGARAYLYVCVFCKDYLCNTHIHIGIVRTFMCTYMRMCLYLYMRAHGYTYMNQDIHPYMQNAATLCVN